MELNTINVVEFSSGVLYLLDMCPSSCLHLIIMIFRFMKTVTYYKEETKLSGAFPTFPAYIKPCAPDGGFDVELCVCTGSFNSMLLYSFLYMHITLHVQTGLPAEVLLEFGSSACI